MKSQLSASAFLDSVGLEAQWEAEDLDDDEEWDDDLDEDVDDDDEWDDGLDADLDDDENWGEYEDDDGEEDKLA